MSPNPSLTSALPGVPSAYPPIDIIPDGSSVSCEIIRFHSGDLKLYTADGSYLCSVRKNAQGNRHDPPDSIDISYSLISASVDETLLPFPQTGSTQRFVIGANSLKGFFGNAENLVAPEQLTLEIDSSGTVTLSALPSTHGTAYHFEAPPVHQDRFVYLSPEPTVLSADWTILPMEPDHLLSVYDADKNPLATVYQTVGNDPVYVIRSLNSDKKYVIDPAQLFPLIIPLGQGKSMRVWRQGKKILLSGENGLSVQPVSLDIEQQIPSGEDGMLEAYINGGGALVLLSQREVGKSKYELVNEDNGGFCIKNGRIVIGDGVGGRWRGQKASALAVRVIANYPGPLKQAIHNAGFALSFLNRNELDKAKLPDTVFGGVQLRGNRGDFFGTGDTRRYVVHQGKVTYTNRPRSVLMDWVKAGYMTEQQAYTDPLYADYTNMISTTLGTVNLGRPEYDPDIEEDIPIPKNSRVVLVSDGSCLSDEEIAQCVDGYSAKDGLMRIKDSIARYNGPKVKYRPRYYQKQAQDGSGAYWLHAPWDNFVGAVYAQDY